MLTNYLSKILLPLLLVLYFYSYTSYTANGKEYIQACFIVYENKQKVADMCVFAIVEKNVARSKLSNT